MRLLVTGCAGFIGSAFCRMLFGESIKKYPVSQPDRVVGLDALKTGSNRKAIAGLEGKGEFRFVMGDICDSELVNKLIVDEKIDTVVNFAAETHVDRSIDNAFDFVHSNVRGVVNLLEIAKRTNVKLVQVSTDEVYGDLGNEGSFTETTPLAPSSPYSASKAAGDLFVHAFIRTHKIEAIITRCSNNFGPFQHDEKFIPVCIKSLRENSRIPVYGTGMNVRDWLFVEDHAWGVYLATTRGRSNEVYNFGGFGERTNLDVANALIKLAGKTSESIEFVTDRKGHDWRYSIDSQKAQKELGWQPSWDFEDGLAETFAHYQSLHSA